MPYSESLDTAIAALLTGWGTTKKKMFGGTCYLLNGNMLCGVHKDSLVLRLGQAGAAEALSEPFVRPFDVTGRAMKGWVMVEQRGYQGEDLVHWLARARDFVATLPSK